MLNRHFEGKNPCNKMLPEPLNKSIYKVDTGKLHQSKENRGKTQDNINIQGCGIPNLIKVKI